MKILWVTAQVLPSISDNLGSKKSNFGGWVETMLSHLKCKPEYKIAVVSCYKNYRIVKNNIDNIDYYIIPEIGRNKQVNKFDCLEVINDFEPDIIHIEGTEFSIQNEFSKFNNTPCIVSLQGILNGHCQYQFGEIELLEMMNSLKIKDIINAWTLFLKKKILFNKRLNKEKLTIKNADILLGRTFWDRAHSYWINPEAKYFICNRILRPIFYKQRWSYEKCEKETIFIGNSWTPIKGAHFVIEAIAILKKEFPNIKLFIAGKSPYDEANIKDKLKTKIGYSSYLKNLINKLKLNNNIFFTGELSENEMSERLLKSNVYVLASLIENSPNTLGEAMTMGVPCISAYTGGAPQMAKEDEVFFYRANDPDLLAWQIKRVFEEKSNIHAMTEKARKHALKTHDIETNVQQLCNVYNQIYDKSRLNYESQ